jgi:hypothetical protein
MKLKEVVMLAIAVFIGIYVYRKLAAKKAANGTAPNDHFEGPDVDPVTGAYLGPGARDATVEFSAQDN